MTISRRQFLRRTAIAVAGIGLARPGLVISRGPAKKVLILGAGMAGLVAGYELSRLGHDVILLEARTRPGGRVQTLREPFSDGLFAEAGAARIPENHDLTLKYVRTFELPLEAFYPPQLHALRFDTGRRQEVSSSGFTEVVAQNFGSELGGSPARWQKIKGGMDHLPKAFAQQLASKIRYGSPVVKIEQDAAGVQVTLLNEGRQESISADRALCTIPFSVLKKIDSPGFSERRRKLIKGVNYDAVSRVYLQTKDRFWEGKGLSGFVFTSGAVEVWQPTWNQPGSRGILMTYARPGQAERITSLKETDRVSTTLTQLDGFFPGLRSSFERGSSKCWTEDEWSRGAWAIAPDLEAAQSPEGRVHFAGEHLSHLPSWIQGALWSGLQAVKQIDEAA